MADSTIQWSMTPPSADNGDNSSSPNQIQWSMTPPSNSSAPSTSSPGKISSFFAGVGKGFGQQVLGAQQLLGSADSYLGGKQAGEWLKQNAAQGSQSLTQQAAPYAAANPISEGAGEFAGQVIPQMLAAPEAAAGALARIGQGAVLGGIQGVVAPVPAGQPFWSTKASQVGEGTAAGALGAAVPEGIRKAVKDYVTPEARALMNEGIRLTPGQMGGGLVNDLEQKAAGVIPITGHLIQSARERSIKDFNTVTLNKALAPIGEELTGTEKYGHAAVAEVGDKLDAAYDRILSNPDVKFLATNKFISDYQGIRQEAATLAPDARTQFTAILKNTIENPNFVVNGELVPTARDMKDVLAKLGAYARQYSSSPNPDQRLMAGYLRDVQNVVQDAFAAQNPQIAGALKAVDKGWAQLVRIENAAGHRLASGGIFTPADLLSGIKKADTTVRKRAFARGEAMLQKWASTAQKVLPKTVPDSGTAGRYIMAHTLAMPFRTGAEGALGLNAAGAAGAGLSHPLAAAAALGATGLYTKPGIAFANKMQSPAVIDPFLRFIEKSSPLSGLVAGKAATQ